MHFMTKKAFLVGFVAVLSLLLSSCAGKAATSLSVTTGPSTGRQPVAIDHSVGSPLTVGDIGLHVLMWTPVEKPIRPLYPLDRRPVATPGPTVVFYQGIIRVANNGKGTVWVDPHDFSAVFDSGRSSVIETWSGPPARTLLHGASLDVFVTFLVPKGEKAELVYRPAWLNGYIAFRGEQKALVLK